VVINFGASVAGNVTIGDQVSIGPRCVIGHDTVVEAFALLAPAAVVSGHCTIGEASYVGAGATIRQQMRVGSGALVGMGAVVVKDVPPRAVVVGNPALPLPPSGPSRTGIPATADESPPVAANVGGASLSANHSST
jgi:acetyltransferase-like isoleucine patch superfamily enzyme